MIPSVQQLEKLCPIARNEVMRIVLSPCQRAIYDTVVAGDGLYSVKEISCIVNRSETGVAPVLSQMRRAGIMVMTKNNEDNRKSYYRVKEQSCHSPT